MAARSVVVEVAIADAPRLFSEAITAAGGTIAGLFVGQSARFTITRKESRWTTVPFEGTAAFFPVGPGQTRIDVVVKPTSTFVFLGVFGLVVWAMLWLFVPMFLPPIFAVLMLILGLAGGGYQLFQANGPWAEDMAERILSPLVSSARAVPLAAQGVGASPGPSFAAPSPPGSPDIAGQLVKLAELHQASILTDDEFAAKKAELLKRL